MAKKSKAKKIVSLVMGGITLAGVAFAGYQVYQLQQLQNQETPQIETLETPNVMFNETTSILSWNDVENATAYVVSINGTETTVNSTSTKVDINTKTTEMKVKATSNLGYKDSDWSNTYTYTISAEDTQKNLRVVISDFLGEDAQLKDIVSMNIIENRIYVTTKTMENNVEHLHRVRITYDNNVTSLTDALTEFNLSKANIVNAENLETVEYDTLSEIIKQKRYGTKIENFVNQGYELSVVNSATTKFDENGVEAVYYVYGLVKLTKDNDIKYIDLSYKVSTEKEKYEYPYINFIKDTDKTSIRVSYANELSGDAYEFAKKLEQEHTTASTQTKATSYTKKTASDVIIEDNGLGYEA